MSSTAIFILIAGCSLTIIAIIINRTKRYIIYIPIAMFMISMCVIELYPKIIIPLFYKMEPLPAGELKDKIESMCKRADIDIDGIYMIDSGRISNSVNARMIGFGRSRKIVINDTLINIKNNDEILAIIGHEMCHYVEEHMLKGISIALLSLFLFIPLLKRLAAASAAGDIKFLAAPQRHSILLLLLIFLLFLSDPVKNAISRHFEKRADEFSINITGNPEAFIGIKKKTAVTNKSLILPNKVYTWYYYTHPAVLDRIRYAESRLKEVNRGRSADL
jgi:STE24 endopeptidase